MCVRPHRPKLARALREVAHLIVSFLERERRLTGNDSLDLIVLGLTHRGLPDIIGTRRESVTLAFDGLERERLIAVDDGRIIVRNITELRGASEA